MILDAGTDYEGTGPAAKPGGYAKDVVLRVDRADGFVGRNFLTRGAQEHTFYNEEVDGILLDRVKFFWGADYGHLSFTSDHNLVENCEGFGAGDAAVYPGAAPETGSQATDFYPDAPRANTVITNCDLHGSTLAYSGSMGNAVRITNNHIYGNTTGISSDTLSAAGHPGFPADSSEIDHNYIYSNNLNLYTADPPVDPLVGVPIGTGILYAGMNDASVHDNWIFDNWRDGAMLFAVPDALTNGGGAEGDIFPGVSCPGAPANGFSTSCGNQFFRNHVGRAPNGFRFPRCDRHVRQRARPRRRAAEEAERQRLLVERVFPSNTGNCWFDNTGFDGTAASVTGPGEAGRLPGDPPQVLPSNCATSVGNADLAKLVYLIDCGNGPDEDTGPTDCDWWSLPPKPGTAAAQSASLSRARAAQAFEAVARGRRAEGTGRRAEPLTGVVASGLAMLVLVTAAVALSGVRSERRRPRPPQGRRTGRRPGRRPDAWKFHGPVRQLRGLAPGIGEAALRDDRGHPRAAHSPELEIGGSPTSPTRRPTRSSNTRAPPTSPTSCGSTSSTPAPRPSRRSPRTRAKPIRPPERRSTMECSADVRWSRLAGLQRARVTRSSTRAASGMFGVRHTCRCSKGQA